jgi:tRNA-dihydrouridine synthase A
LLKSKEKIFCIAPMMDWTDRHCRAFHRTITCRTLLYTEMVTSAAVKFGRRDVLLSFSAREQPVALQLGGADPDELALAARIGEDYGYREINLNCGCPSDRVQEGRFGACLMAEPEHVGECLAAMRAAVSIPVTVKCRIGIDEQDEEDALDRFAAMASRASCPTIIVHARKAWLKGLSPRENRTVPPLNYERVYRLKRDHPALEIVLNGGIASLDEAEAHLAHVDGVMLGRLAYQHPYVLADVDRRFFAATTKMATRREIVQSFMPYVESELARGTPLARIARHMLGLFHGEPGGRTYRRILSEEAHRPAAGLDVLRRALVATERRAILQAAE